MSGVETQFEDLMRKAAKAQREAMLASFRQMTFVLIQWKLLEARRLIAEVNAAERSEKPWEIRRCGD